MALLQGGVDPSNEGPKIRALASVFVEPVWLFTRLDPVPDTLAALAGRRLAIGTEGSGTRLLLERLLALNGIDAGNTELAPLGGSEAVDVVATVATVHSAAVQRILPPAIDWRIRSRVFRWYRELREIEHDARQASGAAREDLRARLDALEARLRELTMPLSRNNLVYDLRQHLELVRNRLEAPRPGERTAA